MNSVQSDKKSVSPEKWATDGELGDALGRSGPAPLLTCLKTLGLDTRSPGESDSAHEPVSATDWNDFYERQIELARERAKGKISLGLIIHEYSDEMFNQMQTPWAEMLRNDDRFQLFVVITSPHLNPPEERLDRAFRGIPWIWAPDEAQLVRFDFFDALVALDFAASRIRRLPPKALRFLQPHGTDILARYSYMFYGAGLMFDHLLCPSFSEEIVAADLGALLLNLFPGEFVDHSSDAVRLIPFGSMKVDHFIQRCTDARPEDIIYNFSYWEIESEAARAHSRQTVAELLKAFPDRRLIFRPFPGDEPRHRQLIDEFAGDSRFVLSTAPSYIEDYRNGAVLIYHRGSSAEVFSMATLQPSILYDRQQVVSSPVETEIGYQVCNSRQLIEIVGEILKTPHICRQRLEHLRSLKYPTAGNSLEIFLDQLHRRLTTGRNPGTWRQLPLRSSSAPDGLKMAQLAVIKALRQGDLIPMLGTSAADAYPDEPLFQLYAAWSVFVHIYPCEIAPHPWLIGIEYLAAFFRSAGDRWEKIVAGAGAGQWLAEELPAKLLGLWSRSISGFDDDQNRRLKAAVAELPLNPFEPASIPWKTREQLSVKRHSGRCCQNLNWKLAATLEQSGDWLEAMNLVRNAVATRDEHKMTLCRLLHRSGDNDRALGYATDLFNKKHTPERASTLLGILADMPPVEKRVAIAVKTIRYVPDTPDGLAPAVNLSRVWNLPMLTQKVLERLAASGCSRSLIWGEMLAGRTVHP